MNMRQPLSHACGYVSECVIMHSQLPGSSWASGGGDLVLHSCSQICPTSGALCGGLFHAACVSAFHASRDTCPATPLPPNSCCLVGCPALRTPSTTTRGLSTSPAGAPPSASTTDRGLSASPAGRLHLLTTEECFNMGFETWTVVYACMHTYTLSTKDT
jgi:hypothetical protein